MQRLALLRVGIILSLMLPVIAYAQSLPAIQTDIGVDATQVNRTLTQAQIALDLKPSTTNEEVMQALHQRGKAGGTVSYDMDRKIVLDITYFPTDGATQVVINAAHLTLRMKNMTLFIASDLSACLDQAVLAHESKHIAFRHAAMAAFEQNYKNSLQSTLATYQGQVVANDNAQSFVDDIYAKAYRAVDAQLITMQNYIVAQDQTIDTPASYIADTGHCF